MTLYDKEKNYKQLMDEAAASGDYAAAARYERQRNAKIKDISASDPAFKWANDYSTAYSRYLGSDYTPNGTYNDAGMSAEDQGLIHTLQDAWKMYNSLGDQERMDAAHAQAEAVRAQYGYSGGSDGSDYIKLNNSYGNGGFSYAAAPTYADKYQSQIDGLLNQILNRDDFSYDVTKDPLYAQYAQQYTQQGQRSMKDTLGQIAARTGGMASSYASSAAQQAGDYYAGQLANKVPELYQLAYNMYLDDKESQVEDLGLLQGMSDTQYGRFRDTMSDWRNDRDFAYGVYRDEIGDSQWQQNFDYGAAQDQIANDRYNSDYLYGQALQKAQTLAQYGDFSGYKELGYTDAQIQAMQKAYQEQMAGGTVVDTGYKPTLTWSQVKAEIEAGNTSNEVLKAYEHYMGDSYVDYGPGYGKDGNLDLEQSSGIYDTIAMMRQKGVSDEEIFRMLDEQMNLSDADIEKLIEYFNLQ